MKTTIIIATALIAVATTATAKSWRINNNTNAAADFASINDAMASSEVVAGDTLYLDPGCSLSSEQTVSKQVTIIGPGFFRNDVPHLFATFTGALTITAANTKVKGVILNGSTNIRANYVTIERCKAGSIIICGVYNQPSAQFATIRQCYLTGIEGMGTSGDYYLKSASATIENCMILGRINAISGLYSPTIRNNYMCNIFGDQKTLSNVKDGTVTNNIIINFNTSSTRTPAYIISATNCTVTNNVMSCPDTAYPEYPDNKFTNSTSEADIFALTGTNDQRYQLKDDSPAKGYATDGGDCGPFGGLYPYVLGGLPNGYPYYTKAIIAPKSVNGKVNVSLNIKMQNE